MSAREHDTQCEAEWIEGAAAWTACDCERRHQDDCAATIKAYVASRGIEVNVSEQRAGMQMPTGFEPLNMRCPHGVPMWMEPTSEQRVEWFREGVA